MNKRLVITGPNGFVGKNLSETLKSDFYLIGISRSKQVPSSSISKILLWNELNLNSEDVYGIIHLSGKAHDLENTTEAKDYFAINTDLTKALFDKFIESDTKVFIYFSSVKAAADRVEGVLNEEVNPTPKTPYGQSKLAAEQYILSKILPQDKKVYILRPCMIHGPGNKGNLNLLYKFVKKGIPYPLAAFNNKRSFLYIGNLGFIISKLLMDSNIPSGIYNVADDQSLSTVEVVEAISAGLRKKKKLLYLNKGIIKALAKVGDVLRLPLNSQNLKKLTENYEVSNAKIKNAIGVSRLPVNVAEGLKITTQSFENRD